MIRHLTVVLTEQDLIQAARLHMWSSMLRPKTLLWLGLLWLFTIILAGGINLAQGASWHSLRAGASIFVPLAGVLVALLAVIVPLASAFVFGPSTIRRQYRQQKALSEQAQISWTDDAYEVQATTIQSRTPWVDYVKLLENQHVFLFYPMEAFYQILPKRALSEAQTADLQAILDHRK